MSPKDKIYHFISEELTSGNITKDTKLTEQYLSDNTGLSRTPVREALFELASEGILDREPRKGFKFKKYNKNDLENLYTYIGVLDGKIAEDTVALIDNKDIKMFSFLIESMDSAINNELYTKYNELQKQFHDIYIDKSQNKLLKSELLSKKNIFIGKSYSHIKPEYIKSILLETNQEHRKILEFIENKDCEKLRWYVENVHWRKENVHFDIW